MVLPLVDISWNSPKKPLHRLVFATNFTPHIYTPKTIIIQQRNKSKFYHFKMAAKDRFLLGAILILPEILKNLLSLGKGFFL